MVFYYLNLNRLPYSSHLEESLLASNARGALGPLLFFSWVSVTWSLSAYFTHHKPMKTSLIKAVGGKAEQGTQIFLFCPSEVAAWHCPPHQPGKPANLWLPGTPGGAGSWSGISLKGGCVMASHEDKEGWPGEGVIDTEGIVWLTWGWLHPYYGLNPKVRGFMPPKILVLQQPLEARSSYHWKFPFLFAFCHALGCHSVMAPMKTDSFLL